MTHYIIQTITFQLFFLLIYDAFLKKETFFNWNRVYLLVTVLLSISLPFIKIERFKNVVSQDFIIRLPEVVIGNITTPELAPAFTITEVIEPATFQWLWVYVLCVGMVIATVLLLYKSYKIYQLIKNNPKRWNGNLIVVQVLKSTMAFSFFNYIFLGEKIKASERTTILNHEMVHVKHKHSADLVFFELLRIVFWFNPLVYMYQNRIASLHEFIADAEAVMQNDKTEYYQNLLSQIFDTENVSFINPFFKKSLIKKRIIMLSKSKSKQVHLLKYALLIPMVFGMLLYTSCEIEGEKESLDQYSYTLKKSVPMNDEQRETHEKYESFLINNPDYVSWAEIDFDNDEISYSIHLKSEKVPYGFTNIPVNFKNGDYYTMYMNLKSEKPESKMDLKFDSGDYSDAFEVPFAVIDYAPTHSSCEGLKTNEERKNCISSFITSFVNTNFDINIANENGLRGQQRINVIFKIDTNGNVIDVKSHAPHPALEAEAIRVVSSFPKFIPGKHKGKAVVVPYSLPILFMVNE